MSDCDAYDREDGAYDAGVDDGAEAAQKRMRKAAVKLLRKWLAWFRNHANDNNWPKANTIYLAMCDFRAFCKENL